ncbi:enoyl-CoA hydratase/isomerase family protein [Xenophilus arseniciresistens]|uniref:Enoyl-CoA hydratase/isomerase family protein n=1 Tax=Xenophilus arseniciresistens TaxID=1283306 RepID=A0AAE3NCL9_9BURK|nr:enoyl-CoA hydratase/isomerase family protein [Xenophilus arseniciresistens]MDA7419206.1 enoyl-CoA hydratase/isomerase family protein [Xenophilus arseniciresistens]
MAADSVQLRVEEGVAVLTLNRPGAKNAIDAATTDALTAALRALRNDDRARAVVLTGDGGDFCAGGDVKGMADGGSRTVEQRREGMARYAELARALMGLDKPLIAAVDGVAFGAGLSMALYADLVLVSTRARMAMVFHRIGLVPDVGAWYQLPRVVGLQRAKELIYSAREFGAQEALDMGLALEVLAPDALMPRAMALAASLAGASSTAFALSKSALGATPQSDFETVLAMEASAQAIASSSAYFREAIRRFAAKEPAQFRWPAKDSDT